MQHVRPSSLREVDCQEEAQLLKLLEFILACQSLQKMLRVYTADEQL
jgi:hypothetical protein